MFISVSTIVTRAMPLANSDVTRGVLCEDLAALIQILGSETRRWIQSVRNAGRIPMKKTARHPNRGSTMADTNAASA